MARKKKKNKGDPGPAWLITFSDMMTLMLTFFVLLVSMSVMDERRKLVVFTSVSSAFGEGTGSFNPLATKEQNRVVEPGPFDGKTEDLAPLKDILWEDQNNDLNFQQNQFVQILSINEEVLFKPGTTELSPRGYKLLDRILPWLLKIEHPLLLAGHTAGLREEEGENYKVDFKRDETLSSTWRTSFLRVMSIYQYLTRRGMNSERLSVEAFGNYRPRWSDKTPEGRRKNRRVDIVLDKRNQLWIDKMESLKEKGAKDTGVFNFKDFRFRLSGQGQRGAEESLPQTQESQ